METSAFSSPLGISEPPRTLLVVEDNPMIRELETHFLRQQLTLQRYLAVAPPRRSVRMHGIIE